MYSKFVKNFLEYAYRLKGMEYMKILEKSQWSKQEEIARMQWYKLRALMNYAYSNVPYYHRVFRERGLMPNDIKSQEDLIKLPVLTKAIIKRNFSDLTARGFPRKEMILSSTGGSTGEPLRFYKTKECQSWGFAAECRAYGWSGYELGDKQTMIWGSYFDLSRFKKLRGRLLNLFLRIMVLDESAMSEVAMQNYVTKLLRFKPKLIRGAPSGVYIFAKFLEKEGIDVEPDAIVTSCESLFDYQRAKMENVFNCKVYDFYGSREVSSIASECSEHNGYHISSENVLLEFIRSGEQVATNEAGTILVTNLNNYAMPFIRYEIGDIGRPLDENCPCGRGLPLMGSLEGRITDVVTLPDGTFVSASILTIIFKDLNVKEYQIFQESYEKFLVKIVKDDQYSQKDSNYILRGMHAYLGENTQIDIEFFESLPRSKSGKRKVVISKVPFRFK